MQNNDQFDILTITNNNKTMVFNYFDSDETINNKATLICSNINEAHQIIKEFKAKQENMYLKAYIEYLKKACEDNKLAVIQTLYSKNNKSVEITIFDDPESIIRKYSEFFGKELSNDEKIKAIKHYNHIMHTIINEYLIKEKGKTK